MRFSRKFRLPKFARRLQVGRFLGNVARGGLSAALPGGGILHDLAGMAGDPKQAKRAVRKMKRGQHAGAARAAKKAGGGRLAGLAKSAGRARAMMGQLKKGNVIGAAFGELSSLTGLGSARGGGGGGRHRMNVGNTKALRRSMRRVEGFAKLAKKTMSFVTHHKLKVKRRGR